jgi:hypothetical protein
VTLTAGEYRYIREQLTCTCRLLPRLPLRCGRRGTQSPRPRTCTRGNNKKRHAAKPPQTTCHKRRARHGVSKSSKTRNDAPNRPSSEFKQSWALPVRAAHARVAVAQAHHDAASGRAAAHPAARAAGPQRTRRAQRRRVVARPCRMKFKK